jgi:shikimate dehydrogenase
MSAALPLVIVTLPARSLGELRDSLPTLTACGADALEVRVDRLPFPEQDRIAEVFPSPLPLVATYRSELEGGTGANAGPERTRRIRQLAALPFAYLDLEQVTDAPLLAEWAEHPGPPTLLVSRHLPDGAPTDAVRRALEPTFGPRRIVKVVVPASLTHFYRDLRPLVAPSVARGRTILHTTGPSGPILRARAGMLGLAGVFAAPPCLGSHGGSLPAVEPSQVPVDALVPILRAGSTGRLFALLGHPVAHSASPRIHTTWYRRSGLAGLFVALDIESAEEFREVLGPLHLDGFSGFNVTHPWKEVALRAASRASADAVAAGCANTLTFENGQWNADNFDVNAVVRRMSELKTAGRWSGEDLLVLGSGGAARAALTAARHLGVPARIQARRRAVTEQLARSFDANVETKADRAASLIIHATPVGRAESPELELAWQGHLRPDSVLLDFVYAPEATRIRDAVEAKGGTYEDGGRLLVYQAAEAYRRWWGQSPEPSLVDWALKEVGCTA